MPTVVCDQERVRRVEEDGSRRKRDLAAYRRVKVQEQSQRLEALGEDSILWEQARPLLAAAVPDSTFNTWLSPLQFVGADDQTVCVAAPEGIRPWVERRYAALIREALQAVGEEREIEFVSSFEGGASCL
jgi:hypothetical protein